MSGWVELLKKYADVFSSAWRERDGDKSQRHAAEIAFLPAALELVERPASPAPRIVLWVLSLLVLIAIVWACVGKVDIVAVARGKLSPSGNVKVVQAMLQGEVKFIHVRDGQFVRTGEVLLELVPTTTEASLQQSEEGLLIAQLDAMRAERLIAAARAGQARVTDLPPMPQVPPALYQAQQTLLTTSYAELQSQLQSNDAETKRLLAGQATTEQMQVKLQTLLPTTRARTQDYERLAAQGAVPQHAYLERKERLTDLEQDLAVQQRKLTEVSTVIAKHQEQRQVLLAEFINQQQKVLLEAREKQASLTQERVKLQQQRQWLRITAPANGFVQELAVHSQGAVVTPAQKLLTIVPNDDSLEVEAWLENRDIGFVFVGNQAEVKIDAFPYTRYGTLLAEVVDVSTDAVTDEDKGLIYKMRLKLDRETLQVGQKRLRLSPGMAVSAEVKTGERRLIEYFLSPVLQYQQESLRER